MVSTVGSRGVCLILPNGVNPLRSWHPAPCPCPLGQWAVLKALPVFSQSGLFFA